MLITSYANGTQGALGAYKLGTDYKCTARACYGLSPEKHAQFEALQAMLNRFSVKLGFAPIAVDGFPGGTTLTAVKKVLGSIGGVAPPLATTPWSSFEEAARYTPELLTVLTSAAQRESLPVVAAPAPSKIPSSEKKKAEETAAIQAGLAKPKSNTLWWVLGFGAVAAAMTVGYLTYKRKTGSAPSRGRRAFAGGRGHYRGRYRGRRAY